MPEIRDIKAAGDGPGLQQNIPDDNFIDQDDIEEDIEMCLQLANIVGSLRYPCKAVFELIIYYCTLALKRIGSFVNIEFGNQIVISTVSYCKLIDSLQISAEWGWLVQHV